MSTLEDQHKKVSSIKIALKCVGLFSIVGILIRKCLKVLNVAKVVKYPF